MRRGGRENRKERKRKSGGAPALMLHTQRQEVGTIVKGFRVSCQLQSRERERESWLTFVKQELKPEDLPLQYFQHRQHSALFSLFFASLRESSLSHALFLSRGVVESYNFHFITSQMGANKSGQDTQKRQFLCCIFPHQQKTLL